MAVLKQTTEEQDIFRDCMKNNPQSVWGQTFSSLAPKDSELESHFKEVEAMKAQVKNMLLNSRREITENIQFINLLCRLGVAYHFDDEINEQLNHIFTILPKVLEDNDYELFTLANLFRILRQYGYRMDCNVFKKFQDEEGEFKEGIANDIKGILSLYEACFLAIPGDDILDEALVFTRKHLENSARNSSHNLQKHIRNSLSCASHRTVERLDALQYILFYEEDKSADQNLLKFAKLDYNALQLLYKKELALVSSWWKELNVAEKLPYARDRLVESYMFTVISIFERQYSIARMLICKYTVIVTLMDDTYDSYGTLDELRLLTIALQRSTMEAVDELPESMKYLYKVIRELIKHDDTQECSCKTTYATEMMIELATAYNREAIWQIERKAPSFDEYMKNGKVTSAYDILTSAFILGVENMGMKEILWVQNDPDIVVGAKLYTRFRNDISKDKMTKEISRGDFPKATHCYAIEYDMSQDQATQAILKILESKWKAMNDDLVKPNTTVPRILLKYTLNYARGSFLMSFNQDIDLFTYAHNLKPLITSLFINPLSM
ncbi:Terpenoid cyclases/Protein prenyltransferases superfamily protein [Euphorbia peplus]|nr:Terpenoid cyclases/Protein prenyltransferases superfamily protein [Euphorbia peplus]